MQPISRPMSHTERMAILGVTVQLVQDSGCSRGFLKVSQHFTVLLPVMFILTRRACAPVASCVFKGPWKRAFTSSTVSCVPRRRWLDWAMGEGEEA